MKKRFYFTSLHSRLVAYFLIASVIPFMILGWTSYHSYQNNIIQNALSYTKNIMSLTSDKLDHFIDKLDQFYFAVYSKDLPRLLSSMENSTADGIKARLSLRDNLMSLQNFYNLSNSVPYLTVVNDTGEIFYQNDRALSSNYLFTEEPWFTDFVNSDRHVSISPSRLLPYHDTTYTGKDVQYISYARKIVDYNNTKGTYIFVMDFESNLISSLLSGLIVGETDNFFLLNDDNIVYSHISEQYSAKEVLSFSALCDENNSSCQASINQVPYLITQYHVGSTTLKALCMNSIPEITSHVPNLKNITYLLFVVSAFLSIAMAYIFSKRIAKPIQDLKGVTYEVMKGHLDVQVPPLTHDEIGDLGICINKMLDNINRLIRENYAYTLREKELQLQTLQSQINPHFLYNTLETISSIAEDNGLDQVSDIVLSMASLYRYSIDSSNRLVPIRNEVDYISNYLNIIKIRYGERIHIHFDIDKDSLDYGIMKLTLQPLIENALYHGLENKFGEGNLIISIQKREPFILICISDDGVGMNPSQLKKLQDKLSHSSQTELETDNSHIGIYNVYQRLMLHFGAACKMTIESAPEKGTRVSIFLPTQIEMKGAVG